MVKGWTLEATSSLNMNVKVCPADDLSYITGCIALPNMLHISPVIMFGLARRCTAASMMHHPSPKLTALAHLKIGSFPSNMAPCMHTSKSQGACLDKQVCCAYAGLKAAGHAAFVLVAGGLGERLGYSGIKLALPVDSASNMCFLQVGKSQQHL